MNLLYGKDSSHSRGASGFLELIISKWIKSKVDGDPSCLELPGDGGTGPWEAAPLAGASSLASLLCMLSSLFFMAFESLDGNLGVLPTARWKKKNLGILFPALGLLRA